MYKKINTHSSAVQKNISNQFTLFYLTVEKNLISFTNLFCTTIVRNLACHSQYQRGGSDFDESCYNRKTNLPVVARLVTAWNSLLLLCAISGVFQRLRCTKYKSVSIYWKFGSQKFVLSWLCNKRWFCCKPYLLYYIFYTWITCNNII